MKSRSDLKRRLARLDAQNRKSKGDVNQFSNDDLNGVCRRLGLHGGEDPQQPWQRDYPPLPEVPAPEIIDDPAPFFTRPVPDNLQAEELLFLDTETTGLTGGTGCLPFLIGLAWWDSAGLVVRQYFLSRPGREGPMLRAVSELARGFRAVVSFNGASFDLPLLRTRCLLARVENQLDELACLDLLPAARRLWGRRLPDCRQQTVETDICGVRRETGDIEGALIPQVYFDYLREGKAGLLPSVLYHNQRDMFGMGDIFRRVIVAAESLNHPEAAADDFAWRDAWSCARILEAQGHSDVAARWLLWILPHGGGLAGREASECPEVFWRDLIRILKRGGDWRLVERLIAGALKLFPEAPWLHREAAILYEHRLVNLQRAVAHAVRAEEPRRLLRVRRKMERESE